MIDVNDGCAGGSCLVRLQPPARQERLVLRNVEDGSSGNVSLAAGALPCLRTAFVRPQCSPAQAEEHSPSAR